jgi:broad specificity phosphatase PhoE
VTEQIRQGAREAASAAPGTPTTLLLLRHGETLLTPQRRLSGSGGNNLSLSQPGRHQAAQTAAHVADRYHVQAIVTSPLRRCQETAQAVAAQLGLGVRVEQGLRETDFGAWEGMTFTEVRERYPDDLTAWMNSPAVAPTGGGEPFEAVARRVAAVRDALLAQHTGKTVLIVSHVGPLRTLMRLALDAPTHALFRMELAAASLSAVSYTPDGTATVRLLNDTGHLRDFP